MTGAIVDDGPAQIESAENFADEAGGPAFKQMVARQRFRLAVHQGDERMARNAAKVIKKYKANSQLRHREWKQIDDALKQVANDQLVVVDDLRDAGLEVPLDLGVLRYEWEDVTEFSDAEVDMAAETSGDEDSLDYTLNGTPLPLVHKSFRVNLRKLRASRNRGTPFDTAGVQAATRQVAEKLEDIVIGGNSITVEGDSVSGLTDFGDRNTITGNATWDGASSDNIIDDILSTVEALEDANHFPGNTGYRMYIARQNYQEARAKNAGTDDKRGVLELVRNRMATEDDVPDTVFRPADHLDDGEAVMLRPSMDVLQLPSVADVQTIEWESKGGMTQHFKVMGSVMPAPRSDAKGNSGIAHLTGI